MSLSVCAGSTSIQQMMFNSLISMELKWVTRSRSKSNNSAAMARKLNELKTPLELPQSIPVIISTNRKDINLMELKDLYVQCNHSCHRFPNLDSASLNISNGLDVDKLQTALCHSAVVVSVFCKYHQSGLQNSIGSDEKRDDDNNISYPKEDKMYSSLSHQEKKSKGLGSLRDLLQNMVPVTPSNAQLVGFGRAVSDCGLTASIYDVMVIPPLRGMGIGKLIVRRIIRTLINRDIYDISAICSEDKSFAAQTGIFTPLWWCAWFRYLTGLNQKQGLWLFLYLGFGILQLIQRTVTISLVLFNLFFQACGFGDDSLGSTTMIYTKNRPKSARG